MRGPAAAALCLAVLALTRPLGAQDSAYRARGQQAIGPQLLTVYVGASTCSPCRRQDFKAALAQALLTVSRHAAARGMSYLTVGVALDEDKAEGLALLEPHGQFDELLVGGGWIGTGAAEYVWSDSTVTGAIPMLLVLERDLDQQQDYRWMGLGNRKVLRRLVGASEIMGWARRGAPID